jgi:hypothetical protein
VQVIALKLTVPNDARVRGGTDRVPGGKLLGVSDGSMYAASRSLIAVGPFDPAHIRQHMPRIAFKLIQQSPISFFKVLILSTFFVTLLWQVVKYPPQILYSIGICRHIVVAKLLRLRPRIIRPRPRILFFPFLAAKLKPGLSRTYRGKRFYPLLFAEKLSFI